jgi:translocator protein
MLGGDSTAGSAAGASSEETIMSARARQLAVVALALWQVAAAAASQSGLLAGDDVGTISDRYDSAVDPAGYAFSIWGLIYLASLVLAVYQAAATRRDDPRLQRLRVPLLCAFALNGLWIVSFQQEQFVLAQVIIVGLTAALAVAYAGLAGAGRPRSRAERWLVYATVGLYLGWATVATVAGASTTLLALGVDDLLLPAAPWGVVLMVVAAAVVAGVTAAGPPEPGFPLAGAWALAAIAIEQGTARDRPSVALTAALAAAAGIAALTWREYRVNRRGGALGGARGAHPHSG